MSELKNTAIFSAAYERVTGQEVWINTELYDKFLSFKTKAVMVNETARKAI
ncbi:hypothetical protein [Enterococcus faecium]|uniref:hypothetical protein n=1 Tax=Enterococcus faecium TaxID=1352 RepID=UPI0022368E18|nr:hypothetical protein [Enterococcus faecium]